MAIYVKTATKMKRQAGRWHEVIRVDSLGDAIREYQAQSGMHYRCIVMEDSRPIKGSSEREPIEIVLQVEDVRPLIESGVETI